MSASKVTWTPDSDRPPDLDDVLPEDLDVTGVEEDAPPVAGAGRNGEELAAPRLGSADDDGPPELDFGDCGTEGSKPASPGAGPAAEPTASPGDDLDLDDGSAAATGVAAPTPKLARGEPPLNEPFNPERPAQLVSLDLIDLPPIRHTEEQLAALADSIQDAGQLHTVVLRQRGKRYDVVAGAGRIAALLKLRRDKVLARVLAESPHVDDHAALAGIDENFVRVQLPGPELDRLLVQRKEILERLHPELSSAQAKSRAGKASAAARRGTGAAASSARSSTAETAKATGRSTRSVQLSVARRKRAAPEVLAAYEAGKLKATQVDELVKLPKAKQAEVLKRVVGRSREETRFVVQARLGRRSQRASVDPVKVVERLLRGLDDVEQCYESAWNDRTNIATAMGRVQRKDAGKRLRAWTLRLEKLAVAIGEGKR